MTYDGIKVTIDTSESKVVKENRDKILELLKEAHTSATSATHVATPGVSGKKRAAPTGPGAARLDEEEANIAAQHIHKFHRNASECVQQLEKVVGYQGAVVAGTQHVVKFTRVAEGCSNQLEHVNKNAQNLMQQLDSFTSTYTDLVEDLEVLGTAITKVSKAYVTLAANHKAYLDVKRQDDVFDAEKIIAMNKHLELEMQLSTFEDAKVKRAKTMLEIEKERAALKRGAHRPLNNNENDDPTLTTFTINELCKKHKLLEGIDTCHNFEIFKRAGELSAIEHKAKEWKFAERRDGKSNAYPMEY